MRVLWLADVLRAAGLTVTEVPGWRTRGSDTYGPVRGITCHGTGGSSTRTDASEINTLLTGSETAPPPIAQLYLGRQGHWWVVASGTCYHNRVGWAGPNEGYGNDSLLGIEAAHNNRDDPWPDVQYWSYVRGVAALVRHKASGYDVAVSRVAGHKEHQPGDKPDPTFDMGSFRARVAALLAGEDDDMFTDEDRHALLVLKAQLGSLLAGHDTWTSPGGSRFANVASGRLAEVPALRAEVAAARSEEVARDAALAALVERLGTLSGVPLTDAQVQDLHETLQDATAVVGERVLAELRRLEAEREAGLAAQLAAQTTESGAA